MKLTRNEYNLLEKALKAAEASVALDEIVRTVQTPVPNGEPYIADALTLPIEELGYLLTLEIEICLSNYRRGLLPGSIPITEVVPVGNLYNKLMERNGYLCFYKGKNIEVRANNIRSAQIKAAVIFKTARADKVHVYLAELDGQPVTHVATE